MKRSASPPSVRGIAVVCPLLTAALLLLPVTTFGDEPIEERLTRHTVQCKVLGPDGKPSEGATVWLMEMHDSRRFVRTTGTTDAEGRVELIGSASFASVAARDRDGRFGGSSLNVHSQRDGKCEVRLAVATDVAIRLVDERGNPLAGVQVRPFLLSNQPLGSPGMAYVFLAEAWPTICSRQDRTPRVALFFVGCRREGRWSRALRRTLGILSICTCRSCRK